MSGALPVGCSVHRKRWKGGLSVRFIVPKTCFRLPTLSTIAREIADNASPVSVELARPIVWRMAGAAHPVEAHKLGSWSIQSRGQSEDAKEGIANVIEKRPANFPDSVSVDLPDFFNWTSEPDLE